MRLPAVAIAAAFASGIALGLHAAIAGNASSPALLFSSLSVAVLVVFAGFILARMGRLFLRPPLLL